MGWPTMSVMGSRIGVLLLIAPLMWGEGHDDDDDSGNAAVCEYMNGQILLWELCYTWNGFRRATLACQVSLLAWALSLKSLLSLHQLIRCIPNQSGIRILQHINQNIVVKRIVIPFIAAKQSANGLMPFQTLHTHRGTSFKIKGKKIRQNLMRWRLVHRKANS